MLRVSTPGGAGVDVPGVEGVAEEHLLGEGVGWALGDRAVPHRRRGRAVRVDGRLHQIMALTAGGLDLAGIRKVLELQGETRLQTGIIRSRPQPAPPRAGPPAFGQPG